VSPRGGGPTAKKNSNNNNNTSNRNTTFGQQNGIKAPPHPHGLGSSSLSIQVEDSLTIRITDPSSEFNNRTIAINGNTLSEGGIVFANTWAMNNRLENGKPGFAGHNDSKTGEGGGGDKENNSRYNNNGLHTPKAQHSRRHLQTSSSSTTTAPADSICITPPSDLITLTHLHEPAVVFCLRKRYEANEIYTATGPILLALNPFKDCGDSLYSEATMTLYWERGEAISKGQSTTTSTASSGDDAASIKNSGRSSSRHESVSPSLSLEGSSLPPHAYKIADDAFRCMMRQLEDASSFPNQSILVSGESGAGKTVTTKIIMSYLAMLSRRSVVAAVSHHLSAQLEYIRSPRAQYGGQHSGVEPSPPPSPTPTANIEQQVLESNPILESFGNARTMRNDNSSRFGKFIEIQFTHRGCLVGAHVDTYLLEKVRLISQTPGERNYHIFYELLSSEGPSDDLKHQFYLDHRTPHDFKMTAGSDTFLRRDGVRDEDTFAELVEAMDYMGFDSEEQYSVLHTAAALLHTSNLTLTAVTADESRLDRNNVSLGPACELLGVSPEALEEGLCFTTMTISAAGESLRKKLSKERAINALEALIKATYGAMFGFLVQRINALIACRNNNGASKNDPRNSGGDGGDGAASDLTASQERSQHASASFIGLLDIFGFESFDNNSFEQLCINYCNEALQQQFNKFVFKMEQQEYEREGISWSFIEFPDNQDVLQLIDDKRAGVLSILDDMCLLSSKSTDSSFAEAIYKKCQSHTRFTASRKQQTLGLFSIQHYAGAVEYTTANFLEKNKDELPKEATQLLLGSSNMFIQALGYILSQPPSASSSSSKSAPSDDRPIVGRRNKSSLVRVSVGGQFTQQLRQLRERINTTAPHYIRCIKPNDDLIPNRFDSAVVLDQLRCNGILEAVRVSRVGYPQRYLHSNFVERYRILVPPSSSTNMYKGQRPRPQSREDLSDGDCAAVVNTLATLLWNKMHPDEETPAGSAAPSPSSVVSSRSNQPHGMKKWQKPAPSTLGRYASSSSSSSGAHTGSRRDSSSGQSVKSATAVDLVKLGIQIGKTKVFLRQHAFDMLERMRGQKRSSAATCLASVVRMFLARCLLLRQIAENDRDPSGRPAPIDIEFVSSDSEIVEAMGMGGWRQAPGIAFHCTETYESSMAIALKNTARPQEEAWARDPTQFKWLVVDGIWKKNRKLLTQEAYGSLNDN
jgi:myosin-5